jgi:hypothetical protein
VLVVAARRRLRPCSRPGRCEQALQSGNQRLDLS